MTKELARILLKWLVVGALFSAIGLSGWSSELGAGGAAHFLRDGIGARARGMGGKKGRQG
jgi:hypothetical protein